MSSWFSKSKTLLKGFSLLSKISDKSFEEILLKAENCRTEGIGLENIEVTLEELSEPEKDLVIKTVFYLLQRLNIFLIKPTKIQQDLKDSELPESKIDLLLKYYREKNKEIVDSLETRHDGISDINWQLKTVLSSEAQQKIVPPKTVASLELHSKNKKVLNLELNHHDLFEFYEHLETIQQELDSRAKS